MNQDSTPSFCKTIGSVFTFTLPGSNCAHDSYSNKLCSLILLLKKFSLFRNRMNVDTLLEAAKYLEEQEEKAKQRQIPTIPDIAPRLPIIHQQNHVHLQPQQQPQQSPPQQQQQPQPQLQNLQNHQITTTTSLLRTAKPGLMINFFVSLRN